MLFPWQVAVMLAAGSVMLAIAAIAQTQRRVLVANVFSFACLGAALWCFLYAWTLQTPSLEGKLLIIKIGFSLVAFLPLLSLEVTYRFVYERRFLRGWTLVAGLIIPVTTAVLAWTINHSTVFRYDCWIDTSSQVPLLRFRNGPWNVVFYLYIYALATWSFVILLTSLHTAAPWARRARILFFIGRLIPIVTDLMFHFRLIPPTGMNYAPASIAITDILASIAFFGDRIGYRAYVARSNLVEKISDLLIVIDGRRRVLDINHAAAQFLGLTREKIPGTPVEKLFESWSDVITYLDTASSTVAELEKNGEWFELATMPVEEGGKDGVIMLWLRNITRRKQAEQGYVTAALAARAANAAKDRYLAVVSHEIRSPLNSVLGFMRLLEETPLSAEQKEYVGHLSQSGNDLFAVINEVLDFSKIEAGQMRLAPAPFDLREEVHGLCDAMKLEAESKGLAFDCVIATDVPRVLVGDKLRIGQILRNLISNAVKFTAQGSVRVKIDRLDNSGSATECLLQITVADTGIGIGTEEIGLLFRPFAQATPSIQHEFGGTGLGLDITRRFCELMGGMIEVESTLNVGSTFTCQLRLGLAENSILPVAKKKDGESLATLRLLVVDDQPVNRRLLQIMLGRMRHEADTAANGYECLEMLQRKNYQGVILDIEMPGLDGFELAKMIRQGDQSPRPFLIALTAHASADIRERCFAAGMDAYLSKPVTAAALADALAFVVGKNHAATV